MDQCLRAKVYANIREQFNWAFNQTSLHLTREIRKQLASVSLNHPLWNPQRGRVSAGANSTSHYILWSAGRWKKKEWQVWMGQMISLSNILQEFKVRLCSLLVQWRTMRIIWGFMKRLKEGKRWKEITLFLKRCHKEERRQKEEKGTMHLLPEGILWLNVRKKAKSKGNLTVEKQLARDVEKFS